MPPLRNVALAAIIVDMALLGGFLYVSFAPKDIALPNRLRVLRRCLASGLAAFPILFAKALLIPLFPIFLVLNALLLAAAVTLFMRRPNAAARRRDSAWLRNYVEKLEAELVDRRQIEHDLAFMAFLAERDPNCIIELDVGGKIGYCNPATEQTFPGLLERGRAHPVLAGLQDVLSILVRDGKVSARRPFRFGDRVFEQQISGSAHTGRICLYMTDVTEWKRLDQLKTELLNTVSHEFRTPLSSILATARLLENQILGPVTPEQSKMLAIVSASAARLNRMISDLLDLSKIEAGKLILQRSQVDLAEVVENVAFSFSPLAQERGLELVPEIAARPIHALVDGDKIVQVLTNLLNNAFKFTKAGRITLSVEATPAEVRIAVKDTGMGIAADQLHRVFGKFQQFGAAVTGEKGSGLGLSLCKNLVELHDGKISVDSVRGQGTTFSFSLPRLSAQSIFDGALQRLYENAAAAGECLSAFVLEVADAVADDPFEGRLAFAAKLETKVRGRLLKSERDIILREEARVFFIINGIAKPQAKALVEQLIEEMIPEAAADGALNRLVIRAQHTSLPDDGTILEGLQARLAA